MSDFNPFVGTCDEYMLSRTGRYEYRAIRYRLAAKWLMAHGLTDDHTLVDVGAGWTEFDYCLRAEFNWRGRYIPLDVGIDGTNLEEWVAARDFDWFVALEVLEHLEGPARLVKELQRASRVGGVVSVPDPAQVDVFAMDETHLTEISSSLLASWGFTVEEVKLYGGAFGGGATGAGGEETPEELFSAYGLMAIEETLEVELVKARTQSLYTIVPEEQSPETVRETLALTIGTAMSVRLYYDGADGITPYRGQVREPTPSHVRLLSENGFRKFSLNKVISVEKTGLFPFKRARVLRFVLQGENENHSLTIDLQSDYPVVVDVPEARGISRMARKYEMNLD